MCIALFSTAHPDYALILASNRDEYLHRPTAPAAWWDEPHTHVLGGRDLQRDIKGTWLGVTSDGRVAVLTNFREEGNVEGTVSRGAMVKAYLTQKPGEVEDTESFAKGLITGEGARGSGGFSLVCGRLGQQLAVVSNRLEKVEAISWIGREQGTTVGLSNAAFGDDSWPKVTDGEKLLAQVVEKHAGRHESQDRLVNEIFNMLSKNTLSKRREGEDWQTYVKELRNSVFIPVISGSPDAETPAQGDEIVTPNAGRSTSPRVLNNGAYGTQIQTIILLDRNGNVTYVEKTLFEDGKDVSGLGSSLQKFSFKIR